MGSHLVSKNNANAKDIAKIDSPGAFSIGSKCIQMLRLQLPMAFAKTKSNKVTVVDTI